MTSKIVAVVTLALTGIIIADILIHPKGTKTVLGGLQGLTKTAGNQMLGYRAT
jgi:hypothetical protein